jgi:hypothetical protein
MTVLFGTVEYFEKEILDYLANHQISELDKDHISIIYTRLKNEILYDFVCDEKIRVECLQNLMSACDKLMEKMISA